MLELLDVTSDMLLIHHKYAFSLLSKLKHVRLFFTCKNKLSLRKLQN